MMLHVASRRHLQLAKNSLVRLGVVRHCAGVKMHRGRREVSLAKYFSYATDEL